MIDNPYKDLPPLERRPDGSLYRMTPAQRKQAASLIPRECCCCEDGNCIALDDGDTCTCPQTVLSRSAVSGSAGRSCRWTGDAGSGDFRDKDLKRCAVCGGVFVPNPTGQNTAQTAPPEFTGGRKQKVNGKGGLLWTVRSGKSLDLSGSASPKPGRVV